MYFIDIHNYIKKDNLIPDCLLDHLKPTRIHRKTGEKITIAADEIALIKTGVVSEIISEKASYLRHDLEFIIGYNQPIEVECYTAVRLLIYKKDEALNLLEAKDLLHHFFYFLLLAGHDKTQYIESIVTLKGTAKVLFFLETNHFKKEASKSHYLLPEWLTIVRLSKCCWISAYTASKLLHQLTVEGVVEYS